MKYAADDIAADAIKAIAWAHARRVGWAVLLCGVVLWSYCAGKSRGNADGIGHATDSLRKVYAHRSDSLETAADSLKKVGARATTQRDSLLRIHRKAQQTFDAHVRVIDSNTVSIDNGPPVHEIPVALALPPIQTCEPVIQIDSTGLKLKDAQIATISDDRDTWKKRALADEAQKPSRFGLKTGAALGAGFVSLLVFLLK